MKNKDINFVRTNPRTTKYHSTEVGDTLCKSRTAIPRLAAQKIYGICTEFPRNSLNFIKFLLTSTVRLKISEMTKGHERKVELPGIEPRAIALMHQCSTTKLQLPPATIPHSCPYVACSSVLLIEGDISCVWL